MALRRRRPSPLRIDGREYLTTAQTADYLGIRVETLYAYVSRGVVRRRTIEGRRGSFFALAEVEELARRGRAPRAATGPERIHTQITLLDAGDVLRYRGRDVAELATAMTFEQVCALLWDRDVAVRFAARPGVLDAARCAVEVMPAGARPQDLLKVAVDLAGAADPQGRDLRPDAVVATGAGLLGTMAAVLAGRAEPWESTRSADSLAALACRAVGGRGPEAQRLVEATLCLLADHDLATSTRAVRVAASVRANPYSAVSAGLGALDSPLHGMASRPAYRLLRDVVEEPDRAIADVLAAGSGGPPPPGFGHPIYRERDPRADVLLHLLGEAHPGHPVLAAVDRLQAALATWPGAFPNVDLATAALTHVLHLHRDAGDILFALARTAGWIAHLLEEYDAEPLRYRVIGVYSGVRPPT